MEDRGRYICMAENEAGVEQEEVFLDVIAPPSINQSDWSGVDILAISGQNTSLRCPAIGSPPPEIEWLRDGRLVQRADAAAAEEEEAFRPASRLQVDGAHGEVLKILSVRVEDAGEYLCLARNEGGTVDMKYKLEIVVPPYFPEDHPEFPASTRVVLSNHPFSLTCDVVGVPFPTFTWNKEGVPLPRDTLTSVRANRLHVSSAKEHHSGLYHCEASNVAGSAQQSYNVTILGTSTTDISFGLSVSYICYI
ncbi:hemicentin-2-like [Ixodes scapularis]|uniref:hemicentin-2-like n=1 Tax=Ixodes scapularis TaxID=6945 RepID=UPI001AD69CA5|nr:hemicentin-2-like [Ixodes scapularis]